MSRTLLASLSLSLGVLASCEHDTVAPNRSPVGGATNDVVSQAASAAGSVVPTTVHGVNFQVKTQLDQSFCIQVESGTIEGRGLTMQQCGLADTQRWAFPWYSDGTIVIVESQGMCLDGHLTRGVLGVPMTVAQCGTGGDWRFAYTSQALLQNEKNRRCLQIPQAAANAPVSLADCDPTKQNQLWVVSH